MTPLRLFSRRLALAFIVCLSLVRVAGSSAQAQAPSWQQASRGLSVTQNPEKKTAGLGITVQAQGWPALSLQGGVKNMGWGTIAGTGGIDLGAVKIPGANSIALTAETTDWAHDQLAFITDTSAQLTLWVSRMSSAILLQSSSRALQLLTGNVTGNTFDGTTVTPRASGPAYPKYVAYSSAGSVRVQPLGTNPTTLPTLDQPWLLVWYGSNSHFTDTKKPLTYTRGSVYPSATLPQKYAYQADAPLLLTFQAAPVSVKQLTQGGVEVGFAAPAGGVTLLPLFGREHPAASETERWASGLPSSVAQKAQWWGNRLCAFPTTVNETYRYDEPTDVITVQESFSFVQTCAGRTSLAPLPPMLGLVKDALYVNFSGQVVDGNLPTEFGPSLGIENTQTYTWSVAGLKKYTNGQRVVGTGVQPPADVEQSLEVEVDKIISAGHLAPWIFGDKPPTGNLLGDIYWLNPADALYHLIEIASALPDNAKGRLINYIRAERAAYPPERIYNLPLDQGTTRGAFALSGQVVINDWLQHRKDVFLERVPLYNLLALSRYYAVTGDAMPSQVLIDARAILDRAMQEQDWGTFSWFQEPPITEGIIWPQFGARKRREDVIESNRHFAGMVGFMALARKAGDRDAEALGRGLLARAAVLRLGMALYPRYLYSANLVELPPEPDWQARYSAGQWYGQIFNYNWRGPYDDARQPVIVDQFGVLLSDHVDDDYPISPYLTAFRDMVPELARFLDDYAKADSEIYINKVEAVFPHWYMAFAEGMLGAEHNLSHPIDSYQLFIAKAWLQRENADRLARYASFPWLDAGDLFYTHKLAETIKAYRGWTWSDNAQGCASHLAGDVNCDCQVDNVDMQLIVGGWGTRTGDARYDARYDVNLNGTVDVLDIQLIIAHWGDHC